MAITVASWNLGEGLSYDTKVKPVLEGIKRIDADIVILPEAHGPGEPAVGPDFAYDLGYNQFKEVNRGRPDMPPESESSILVMSRLATRAVILGGVRFHAGNVVNIAVTDPEEGVMIDGVGAHFDDRQEPNRAEMALAIRKLLIDAPRTFVAGDLNAMHANALSARLLRTRPVGFLAEHAPSERVRSLGTRLIGMADGLTMNVLKHAGYSDADPKHRATMRHSGVPFGQLDHILTTPNLRSSNFRVRRMKGIDHKAISAKLTPVD